MEDKNILLTISYDGTNFWGWQKQPNLRTVEGVLEKALSITLKKPVSIRGASRTDRGVHSLCQLVLLKEKTSIPMEKLPLVINSNIPIKDIFVLNAMYVDNCFHPQYNVFKKTYQYKIYNGLDFNPIMRDYAEYESKPLDISKMKMACEYFIGEYDFKAFCATGGMSKTTVRTVYALSVKKEEDLITIEITGNGFLYNMVRIICGTLIDVGLGKKQATDIPDIIASKDRRKAGKTASACGLILYKIYYNV